jgi:HAD superfamily hydrolase (TIGR01509 family)
MLEPGPDVLLNPAMSLPHAPQAVIFDMDGLIFDTEALYQRAFVEAAGLGGHDVPAEVIRQAIGVPWVRGRGAMLGALGEGFPIDDYYARMTERFEALSAAELGLKPGVGELLDLLDALDLPRAIATSSSHATAQAHLAAHGLAHRFHAVIGEGDYPHSKPAPDPYLVAAARLGTPASLCLALEDSHGGVRSAAAAGAMTIMVPDLVPPTAEIGALCVCVAQSLHEVAALVAAASAAGTVGTRSGRSSLP